MTDEVDVKYSNMWCNPMIAQYNFYWLLFPLGSRGSKILKMATKPKREAHTKRGAVVSTSA